VDFATTHIKLSEPRIETAKYSAKEGRVSPILGVTLALNSGYANYNINRLSNHTIM